MQIFNFNRNSGAKSSEFLQAILRNLPPNLMHGNKKFLIKKKIFSNSLMLLLLLFGITITVQAQLIPAPLKMKKSSGVFEIDKNTSLQFSSKNDSLEEMTIYFQKQVKRLSGIQLPVNRTSGKTIKLEIDRNLDLKEEGYKLKISTDRIVISAPTVAGVFYGVQSVLQYFPGIRTNEKITLPAMEITDEPAFAWRGMMLDVSRHFYSVETIKEVLDLMAFYKLNTFHWHLTDNEGWRLEIKKYPKLTSIGAWREEIPGSVFYKVDSTYAEPLSGEPYRYGGYYTQEQAREVVAYAAKRNITVIPEIEMPGHSAAALAAYPEFSCAQPKQDPPGSNLWNDVTDTENMAFNYCAGEEAPFLFLQDVLVEVMDIFSSEYIHIGGDEVDKSYWEKCESCQQRIKQENLKNEKGLQSYFIKRMENFLQENNRKLLGWDEILEGGLAPNATVMSWQGEKGGIAAAKSGHDVVMSPSDPLYFNRYQAGPEGEPQAGPYSINTLKRVYNYKPVPEALNANEAKYVLGSQFAIWTEFISSVEHLEYMLLPRMLAFSEAVWSNSKDKNFTEFTRRLNMGHYTRWKTNGVRFHPEFFEQSEY
ncbi:hexosaminidase [Salegentibacter salegens]|uniref:beta-N-acetylhexosaminidase n=3 Tax=Salegentibacter salegens TaxID=143223 RepID=A0A1M7NNM3_9FLAO|nr:beta-N-acetylhexosaminidase [Salegentibacter salegens]PRX43080.1 hexosaminidase [Salegentibacter salegens]SHN05573.1 hexosaminidase [Salegentibacter salegens]